MTRTALVTVSGLTNPALDSGRRGGFTLIEVVVALAIMVMIAATVSPSIIGYLDRTRLEEAVESLEALRDAALAFYDDVDDYPSELTHLTEPISGDDDNSCGSSYGNGQANRWTGPYLTRIIPATGLPIFIGTAQNELD